MSFQFLFAPISSLLNSFDSNYFPVDAYWFQCLHFEAAERQIIYPYQHPLSIFIPTVLAYSADFKAPECHVLRTCRGIVTHEAA